jgi:hypothetical protein
MERSSSGHYRSNLGSLSNTAMSTTKVVDRSSNSGQISGSPSKIQRSNQRSTGTTTLLVVLLGLLAVGQLIFVTPPDPTLTTTTTQRSQTSSSNTNNNLIDPTAWKVSHHLATKEQEVVAAATTTPLDYEILGARAKPPHSQDEYEIVRMTENEASPLSNSKKVAAETLPTTTTTVPTISIPIPPVAAAAAVLPVASNNNNNRADNDREPTSSSDNDAPPTSPLSTMLQQAGLTNISEADLAGLPTLEQLTRQYGRIQTGPVVTGTDTCERYRQQVPQRRRYAAPAGMFNTGTNALDFHLQHNLRAMQKWQVPWGKHRMESVRLIHTAATMETARKEYALPIVMIRDPLHWMQSMVREVM